MTVTTCGFHGTIQPSAPAPYTVRCLTCRAIVAAGDDGVDVNAVQHECADTTASMLEFEVTFTSPVTEIELPLPLEAEAAS